MVGLRSFKCLFTPHRYGPSLTSVELSSHSVCNEQLCYDVTYRVCEVCNKKNVIMKWPFFRTKEQA